MDTHILFSRFSETYFEKSIEDLKKIVEQSPLSAKSVQLGFLRKI